MYRVSQKISTVRNHGDIYFLESSCSSSVVYMLQDQTCTNIWQRKHVFKKVSISMFSCQKWSLHSSSRISTMFEKENWQNVKSRMYFVSIHELHISIMICWLFMIHIYWSLPVKIWDMPLILCTPIFSNMLQIVLGHPVSFVPDTFQL